MSKATDYEKMTPIEHILARPDTYIGSVKATTTTMDVVNSEGKIINKVIRYVPGFLKCFDELLVNARDASEEDKTCDTIKVDCNVEEGYIRIYNNGDKGIPVEEHPKYKKMVPSMIFGELLTSSNYDDSKERTAGGRNGYGAKLASVYATKFEVEVGDASRGKKFLETWSENMGKTSGAKITKYSQKKSYVQVTFYPDFKRFGLEKMEDDIVSLFHRRTIDIAGVSSEKIKVYFNDTKINIANFKQYISLYYPDNDILYDDSNDRWKVGCLYIPDSGNKIVSFVNGIATYKGGSHVNHVVDKVVRTITEDHIKKKNKDIKISPALLKENLVFFITSTIVNPAFESQTKETLSTEIKDFGSKYEPSDAFIKKIAKSGLVEQIIEFAKFKENTMGKKTDGKKTKSLHGIAKLDDANEAGGRNSHKCSLILTEGDSAKTFAVAGLSIVGRDYYGVFPLKGKMMNVRDASVKDINENEEITNLKKILGLRQGAKYDDDAEFKTLRYGRIVALTDADQDGSHIKGLLMNMFHCMWPELLKRENFITSLATPIVKAFKGDKVKVFYNMTDYKDWLEEKENGWTIKYYKGLGTSDPTEAKEYFVDIEDKLIRYFWENGLEEEDEDGNKRNVETSISEDAMTLAFLKTRADDRKEWLANYDRNDILTYEDKEVGYSEFIHRDLKHFSSYDNVRSLPHIMDGFKPSQRKVLFGSFLGRLDKAEKKVFQLGGIVSDKASYHHGDASINATIVGMAQDYVGSNNINVLDPIGMFGSRLQGGKDAASPRYISTRLSKHCNLIFKKTDNMILNKQFEDGVPIEPEFYAPIIPMVLVNGASGIGTGFSTEIPPHNPINIIDNLINMMDTIKYSEMTPYWRGFTGSVDKLKDGQYKITGKYHIEGDIIHITELPVESWTQNYKEFLEREMEAVKAPKTPVKGKPKKVEQFIVDYKEYHTDTTVHFAIECTPGFLSKCKDIEKQFKLSTTVSINNMHMFGVNGKIQRYNTVEMIMREFYTKRLCMYDDRKKYLLDELQHHINLISNKVRFILMVVNDELIVNKRKRADIEKDLEKHKFPRLAAKFNDEGDEDGEDKGTSNDTSYNYLLTMPIYHLTFEKIEELKKQKQEKEENYDAFSIIRPEDIWKEELIELKQVLEKEEIKEESKPVKKVNKKKK